MASQNPPTSNSSTSTNTTTTTTLPNSTTDSIPTSSITTASTASTSTSSISAFSTTSSPQTQSPISPINPITSPSSSSFPFDSFVSNDSHGLELPSELDSPSLMSTPNSNQASNGNANVTSNNNGTTTTRKEKVQKSNTETLFHQYFPDFTSKINSSTDKNKQRKEGNVRKQPNPSPVTEINQVPIEEMNSNELFQHFLGDDYKKVVERKESENLSFDVEAVKKRAHQKYGREVDQYIEQEEKKKRNVKKNLESKSELQNDPSYKFEDPLEKKIDVLETIEDLKRKANDFDVDDGLKKQKIELSKEIEKLQEQKKILEEAIENIQNTNQRQALQTIDTTTIGDSISSEIRNSFPIVNSARSFNIRFNPSGTHHQTSNPLTPKLLANLQFRQFLFSIIWIAYLASLISPNMTDGAIVPFNSTESKLKNIPVIPHIPSELKVNLDVNLKGYPTPENPVEVLDPKEMGTFEMPKDDQSKPQTEENDEKKEDENEEGKENEKEKEEEEDSFPNTNFSARFVFFDFNSSPVIFFLLFSFKLSKKDLAQLF